MTSFRTCHNDHLSLTTIFAWHLGWSQNSGFTVFGKAVKIENCAACHDQSWWLCYTWYSGETTFEYQRAPDWTISSFCFLTVSQETNTSRSPGRATKNIFSVARGQMLVASGDRAPLEHNLDESNKLILYENLHHKTTWSSMEKIAFHTIVCYCTFPCQFW